MRIAVEPDSLVMASARLRDAADGLAAHPRHIGEPVTGSPGLVRAVADLEGLAARVAPQLAATLDALGTAMHAAAVSYVTADSAGGAR